MALPTACCSQEYDNMIDLLKVNEGWKNKVYTDTKGYLTIGCGHMLMKEGASSAPQSAKDKIEKLGADWDDIVTGADSLSDAQVAELLEDDLEYFVNQCENNLDVYNDAPGCVQMVLLDM